MKASLSWLINLKTWLDEHPITTLIMDEKPFVYPDKGGRYMRFRIFPTKDGEIDISGGTVFILQFEVEEEVEDKSSECGAV